MPETSIQFDGASVPPLTVQPPPVPPGQKVSGLVATLYILAFGGAFLAVITPVVSTLAVRISQVTGDQAEAAQAIGWIMGVGALIGLVTSPVIGMLSDRTTSRFGRRRPWLVGGSVLALAGLIAIGLAPDVMALAIIWWATGVFVGGVTMALSAFMPDWVPQNQRGKVGAWVGIAQQCVPLLGIYVAQVVVSQNLPSVLMFLIPGVIGFLFVFIFAFVMPDKRLDKAELPRFHAITVLKSFWFSPRKYPDFAWAWVGRFFISMMFQIVSVYQLYYFVSRFASDFADALSLSLWIGIPSVIVIAISAQVSGWYSDRSGRRKGGVYLGSALFVVSMIMMAFAYDIIMLVAASLVLSIAIGVYYAIDLALVTDVLPEKDTRAANGMGVFNIANTLPGSLAPLGAPFLLAIGGTGENYVALWIGAAVLSVIGCLTVSQIRSVK